MRRQSGYWAMLFAVLSAAPAITPATASVVITIDFTGLNLEFAGGKIYDADHLAGGNGLIADATKLGSINFSINYVPVLSLSGDVYADILIQGVPGIPPNGYVVTSGGSFVDLLSPSGWLLGLDIGPMIVSYTVSPTNYVTISGIATGAITQNLPGGLIIDQGECEMVLLMGDTLSGKVFTGELLTGFTSSGTGQIKGVLVPEPACFAVLLGIGVIGLEIGAWRKRRRRQRSARA
ncbi:MAG: hypothetical protein KKE86_06855 [Planctomycetes bacterium]|nr:hypothetical protein [Planctomycetota bacterium]MBU4399041.1 hypothetical protein [Planctomycetota bacterium]MCG2684953.1 hypothetical protein [Planctomycetales bacterium]